MIKKLSILGVCTLALTAIISCEKDFTDVGTGIVNNTKFDTDFIELEVEINPINISESNPNPLYKSVRADNIAIGNLGEYWFGTYDDPNAKALEASIVSQLVIPSDLSFTNSSKTYESTDVVSEPVLDEVLLKIPLQATLEGKNGDGTPKYVIDNAIGNTSNDFTVNIYQNETYLSRKDLLPPHGPNSYASNAPYLKNTALLLASTNTFSFKDAQKDTVFYFNRTVLANPTRTFKDSIIIANGSSIKTNPFKYIKLNKQFFQENFIDKYKDAEFQDQDLFNDKVFRGVIIEALNNGNAGSALPLDFSNTSLRPSIDLLLTTTVKNKDGEVIDSIAKNHSFRLSGISNSVYKMTNINTPTPANNFVIQGTAGSMAEIKILNEAKLNELKANNWLINDASLTFYTNNTISTDTTAVPQRLLLYQNKVSESNTVVPTQLTDSYLEAAFYGGNLTNADKKPEKYMFRITDYISNLLAGEENTTNDPLVLKVFNNPTDSPVINNILDVNVKTYNWNPRAVTLLNGNASNGTKKAVLKISYSEKK